MFNPSDDMINWQSLIDIKNYDDSYEGEDKRPFCNWTAEQIILFNKKLNQLESSDKYKDQDKEKIIDSIKDIIDFGLPYQYNFFENYEKTDYYYKEGLKKLISKIEKDEKSLEKIIEELKADNQNEKNKINNCLTEEPQYTKIKNYVSKVSKSCDDFINKYKNMDKDKAKEEIKAEIKQWTIKCKEYYKNNPKSNDIEEIEEKGKDEKKIKIPQKAINNREAQNYKMSKHDFANRLMIFQQNIQKPKKEKTSDTQTKKPEKKNELGKDKNAEKENQFKLSEILTFINLGFYCIFDYTLRPTQLISLYILITKKKNLGRIIQVLTGEGKTCIIIGLAIYHVLKNHKVDIVTSNEVLAKRDSEDTKHKQLYDLFNIKIGHCITNEEDTNEEKECYINNVDVIYGDTHNFQADFLKENYYSKNIKKGRREDIIIVDEVDSMLVDEYAKSTLLAGKKPYMESLAPILYYIYYYLQNILGENKDNKKVFTKPEYEKLQELLIKIGEKIINGCEEKDNEGKKEKVPGIPLQPYLKEYALHELKTWAKNAIIAYTLEKDVEYKVDEKGKIVPVDNKNTGVIQENSSLSSGLHQFLEIKEKCMITPINIVTNFQSNYGFFNLYKNKECNNIYGLTGTLGSIASKDLLKKIYDLDFAYIPSFYKRKLVTLCPRLETSDNWLNTVMKTSAKAARNNRVVLVICKSMKLVDELEIKFKNFDPNLSLLKLKENAQANNREIYNNLPPGFIILATNIAGRGMDINLHENVVKNYGLHVCLTFIPKNERVQEQNFGRAGRKGEPGTCQIVCDFYQEITEISYFHFNKKEKENLEKIFKYDCNLKAKFPSFILKNEDLEENKNSNNNKEAIKEIKERIKDLKDLSKRSKDLPINYKTLIIQRDKNEEKELTKVNKEIGKIKIKDKLFEHYLDFIKKKKLLENNFLFRDIEEQWGIWLNRIVSQEEIKKDEEYINEFKKWIKKYDNDDEIHYENDAYLCYEIQNIFQKNNFIHDNSESIIRELATNFKNFFGKNKEDKLKVEKVKERLQDVAENNKNHTNFIFFYYLGMSQILLDDKQHGLNSLQKAQELIIEEYKYLENFIVNSNAYKLYSEYIYNMLVLLYNIEHKLIDPVIEYIKNNKNIKL